MSRSSRTLIFQIVGVAVGLNALTGVVILLGSGSLSDLEERILATVAILSALSVGLLPAAIAWQRVRIEGLPFLPVLSAVSLTGGVAALLVAIWFEVDGDSGSQSVATMLIVGAAAAHLCLLHLARESELRYVATALTIVLAAMFLVAVWTDDAPDWRLAGITAILWLAASLLVPLRQWAAGAPRSASTEGLDAVRYCPFCGSQVSPADDLISCPACGATFTVRAGRSADDDQAWRVVEPTN